MVNKRTPLSDRRAQDKKGVDVIFDAPAAAAPEVKKPALSKVTMYVRPEQITAVEDIQFAERRRTGKRVDKSDLFQEALDLLIAKYNVEK